MTKIISIINQKGGVGKTTTAINLGVALAENGYKVLLIDSDPQANLTRAMGIMESQLNWSLADLYESVTVQRDFNIENAIVSTKEKVDIIPCNIKLAPIKMSLVQVMSRETILARALASIKSNYDYIIIDCPSDLDVITLNAMAASNGVIIPVQTQSLAAAVVPYLLQSIAEIKRFINPSINVYGILFTLGKKTKLASEVKVDVAAAYNEMIYIFDNVIPTEEKAAEAAAHGTSVVHYAPKSKSALAYREFAKEVISRG